MTPQELGKHLFEEQVATPQDATSLVHRLSNALKATQNKNKNLESEYEKQALLVERLKLALKQQLGADKAQNINSKIQKQQINQLIRDLNKTEHLIEEIKQKFILSAKKNKKKNLKNKIVNGILAAAFIASLWPAYLYVQQKDSLTALQNKISVLEADLTHAQSIAILNEKKANKNIMALDQEREDLILSLNKKIEGQNAEILSLQNEQNAKIISFKEDIEILQHEYIAKLELIRKQSGQKISLLEMENTSLAETLQKEKSKPKELIIFKAPENETRNEKTAHLFQALDKKENTPVKRLKEPVQIPSMADAIKYFGAKSSEDFIKPTPHSNHKTTLNDLALEQLH